MTSFAEASKGNLYTHIVKLIELRAYGKHRFEGTWLQTVNQFRKALLVKIHPDRAPFFTARGDHYATFVNDVIGLAMMMELAIEMMTDNGDWYGRDDDDG